MRRLADVARREGVDLVVVEGGSHTKVVVGPRRSVVPRHKEINEITARAILRQMGADA